MSLKIQYTLIGIIVLIALVWAAVRFHRTIKRKNSSCTGCSLKDNCKKNPAKKI